MLRWIKRNTHLRRTGHQLYESIVAQARQERFFRELGVADTMQGRFELIVLHMLIVLERLKREGEPGQRIGQIVLERLIAEMDDAVRQSGIGDMGVPRRVQRAAAAISERARDYAFGSQSAGRLEAALAEHVYGAAQGRAEGSVLELAGRLAAYARASLATLEAMPSEAVIEGRSIFAAPAGAAERQA